MKLTTSTSSKLNTMASLRVSDSNPAEEGLEIYLIAHIQLQLEINLYTNHICHGSCFCLLSGSAEVEASLKTILSKLVQMGNKWLEIWVWQIGFKYVVFQIRIQEKSTYLVDEDRHFEAEYHDTRIA